MNIEARRLRFLLAVARSGGVLAAADDLRMTPSAVSQQLARLEQEAGAPLLTRTSHGSTLTAAGLVLAEAAQQIERMLLDAAAQLTRVETELRGVVRIGSFQSFLSVVVAPTLADWKRALPGVHFEVVEGDRDPLLRSLKAGEVDIAVVEFDADEPPKALPRGTTEVPLLDEPWKLVVPAGTLLSDPGDLGRLDLPWLGSTAGAAGAQAVQRLNRASGSSRSTMHRLTSTQGALALAAAGEGVALIPLLALHGQSLDGLDVVDVPGLGTRRIVLRSHDRAKPSPELITSVTGLIRDAAARVSTRPTVAP